MENKFLISSLNELATPFGQNDYSIVERNGVTYKVPMRDIDSTSFYADGIYANALSLYHISRTEYFQKLQRGETKYNEIYFVSADTMNAYRRRLTYLGEPISSDDAATKNYVDQAVLGIKGAVHFKGAVPDISDVISANPGDIIVIPDTSKEYIYNGEEGTAYLSTNWIEIGDENLYMTKGNAQIISTALSSNDKFLSGEIDNITLEKRSLSDLIVYEINNGDFVPTSDTLALASQLPAKTSDLENDSGFITSADMPTPDKIQDANGNVINADRTVQYFLPVDTAWKLKNTSTQEEYMLKENLSLYYDYIDPAPHIIGSLNLILQFDNGYWILEVNRWNGYMFNTESVIEFLNTTVDQTEMESGDWVATRPVLKDDVLLLPDNVPYQSRIQNNDGSFITATGNVRKITYGPTCWNLWLDGSDSPYVMSGTKEDSVYEVSTRIQYVLVYENDNWTLTYKTRSGSVWTNQWTESVVGSSDYTSFRFVEHGITVSWQSPAIKTTEKIALESQIPAKTSDLENDSGFITSSALSGYATETYVDNKLSNTVTLSGTYTDDTAFSYTVYTI